ncbi:MAG: MCP four helix bundle domain-containing protein, partial [Phycisphaerae bacterium]
MKLTIGKRIVSGFAIAILITTVLGVFAYTRLAVVDTHATEIVKSDLPGLNISADIETGTARALAQVLMHIIADNPKEMTEMENRLTTGTEELNKLYKDYEAKINNDEDRRAYEDTKAARPIWVAARTKVVELSRSGKKKEAIEAFDNELFTAYSKMRTVTAALSDLNTKQGEEGGRQITTAVAAGKLGVIIGIGSALAFGILVATLITRSTNKALNRIAASLGEGSEQVASASTQVSSSSQSLAQG